MRVRLPLLFGWLLLSQPARAADVSGDPLPPRAGARFGSIRLRHVGPAEALAWSADGKLLVSSGRDNTVRLWDAVTGRPLRSFPTGAHSPQCLAFTPDGKAIAGAMDGAACLWHVTTGKELLRLDALNEEDRRRAGLPGGLGGGWNPRTQTVAVSADGLLLAAGGSHPVTVWDIPAGKKRFATADSGWTPFVAFTPDGTRLITADQCKQVQTWDATTGKRVSAFQVEGPVRHVNLFSLAVAPDGRHAALKLLDHVVIVDLANGKVAWREKAPGYHDEPVAFSPDGKLLAFAGRGSGVRVWEWARGRQVAAIPEGGEMLRRSCAFAPDGKRLAWTGWDGNIRVWDLEKGKEALTPEGHKGGVALFALRSDGKALATADQAHTVRVWDAASGRVSRTVTLPDTKYLGCLGFARGGRSLILGDLWSVVTSVNLAGEEGPRSRTGPVPNLSLIALGPGGATGVAVDGNSNLTHLVLDAGRDWRPHKGTPVKAYYAAFTPDGGRLIAGGWDYVAYLDAATGKEHWRTEGNFNPNFFRASLAGSPDGRLVAAGSAAGQGEKDGGCVRLFDADNGREKAKLPTPHFRITAAAFSPDSRFLAAASTPYQPLLNPNTEAPARTFPLSLWEIASGSEVCRLHGHEGMVTALAFAPDGRTFYSASEDGTVLQWDALGLRDAAPLRPAEAEALWDDLTDRDASKAYRSVARLVASPREACSLLGKRLKPIRAAAPARLAQCVRDLDGDAYAVREAATRELQGLGEQADGVLREALRRDPSPEVRRRAEALLEERRARPYSPDELRRHRAVLVLECIGSAEALRLLENWAKGTDTVSHVREARAALLRLQEQGKGP